MIRVRVGNLTVEIEDESQLFLTSDPHFWHANVIKYCNRPYATSEEMNEALIANWNATVKPTDVVIVNGDFAMAARAVEQIVPRLNGRKILILGNHDFPHPAHSKGRKPELREKWTKLYESYGFMVVALEGSLEVTGVANFRLFHLPYTDPTDTNQEGKPRHFKERLPDDGRPLLCGHVHEKWLFKRTPKGTPQLNVGVDAPGVSWYMRPASLKEVMEVYLEKTKTD